MMPTGTECNKQMTEEDARHPNQDQKTLSIEFPSSRLNESITPNVQLNREQAVINFLWFV